MFFICTCARCSSGSQVWNNTGGIPDTYQKLLWNILKPFHNADDCNWDLFGRILQNNFLLIFSKHNVVLDGCSTVSYKWMGLVLYHPWLRPLETLLLCENLHLNFQRTIRHPWLRPLETCCSGIQHGVNDWYTGRWGLNLTSKYINLEFDQEVHEFDQYTMSIMIGSGDNDSKIEVHWDLLKG